MKILLVHNYYSQRGGEDIYFDNLKELLVENGHHVILYTKNSLEAGNLGKKMASLASLFSLGKGVKNEFTELIRKERPKIAHFNNIYPLIGVAAYRACRENNIPVVQTIHNYRLLPNREADLGYDNYSSFAYKQLFRAAIRQAIKNKAYDNVDCFIFPSNRSYKVYRENAKFNIRRHKVIPNFVKVIKAKRPSAKSDFFLYAGRFSNEKGILPLLEIFSQLPDLKLKVAGGGPQKNKVMGFKKFKNIDILDWVDRRTIHDLIRNSRAVISPSLSHEVMPLGVIEALALGTPAIVPRKPVFEEVAKNRNGAIFFADNDFEDLKKKILDFKNGIKVSTGYLDHFSPEKHISSLMKLYRKLARG